MTAVNPDTKIVFGVVKIERQVTLHQIKSSICTAIESGLGWLFVDDYILPPCTTYEEFCSKGKYNDGDRSGRSYWHPAEIVPTMAGGALKCIIEERVDESITNEWTPDVNEDWHYLLLTPEKLKRGLQVMAELFPKQFNMEFPSDPDAYEGDAVTADCFMQCALLSDQIIKSKDLIFG